MIVKQKIDPEPAVRQSKARRPTTGVWISGKLLFSVLFSFLLAGGAIGYSLGDDFGHIDAYEKACSRVDPATCAKLMPPSQFTLLPFP